jgi:type I site-specific restriction endonuclease
VKEVAEALVDKGAIPMVKEQLPLIEELLSDAWWEDVTLPMLERVRRRLRALVGFMDTQERAVVYTDFEDELGTEQTIELLGFEEATPPASLAMRRDGGEGRRDSNWTESTKWTESSESHGAQRSEPPLEG